MKKYSITLFLLFSIFTLGSEIRLDEAVDITLLSAESVQDIKICYFDLFALTVAAINIEKLCTTAYEIKVSMHGTSIDLFLRNLKEVGSITLTQVSYKGQENVRVCIKIFLEDGSEKSMAITVNGELLIINNIYYKCPEEVLTLVYMFLPNVINDQERFKTQIRSRGSP
jgi:hypothetical protein